MPRYALLKNGEFVELRNYPSQPANIPHKNVAWLPCPVVSPPAFDPATEKLISPTYMVGVTEVTEVRGKVALTAQEISDAKDAAVVGLNGSVHKPNLQILLTVVNDIRAVRAKINALIDATGQAGTVSKYPAGQVSEITMVQLKNAIKALL